MKPVLCGLKDSILTVIKAQLTLLKKIKIPGNPPELRTLKITLPRRFGNTTLALGLLKSIKDSVLIVHNSQIKDGLRTENPKCKDRIISSVYGSFFVGKKTSVLIVDCASFTHLDNLYKINADFYLFIG